MSNTRKAGNHPHAIRNAGAVLRVLTPPRAATLVLVRGGDLTQRAIADHLDRTPPAVSNYFERLEGLPQPLVERDGHDHWATSKGKQVVSAIFEFGARVGTDLQSGWRDDTGWVDRYADSVSPLYEFRSDAPFLILYALGTGKLSFSEIEDTVKEWSADTITRSQIISRLRHVEDAELATTIGESAQLTEKGEAQFQLLDRIAQVFIEPEPVLDASMTYQTEDETVLRLPSELTVNELEAIVDEFKEEYGGEVTLQLVQARAVSRLKD